MNGHDELVRRATLRLEVDREIQLDVGRELATHLEDSCKEYRQAGCSPEEAEAAAAKALGDPDELAEQLWQANRLRMRMRSIGRWASRVTLVPAAALVVIALAVSLAGLTGPNSAKIPAAWLEGLTDDEKLILQGDPDAAGPLESAKVTSDRWPDSPIFYAQYAVEAMNAFQRSSEDPTELQAILAVLDRGEQLDPENAWYNFWKSLLLVRASSEVVLDPTMLVRSSRRKKKNSPTETNGCRWTVDIHDAQQFAEGLAELRRGAAKRFATWYSVEIIKLRLDLLDRPDTLAAVCSRAGISARISVPNYESWLSFPRAVSAHALQLAKMKDPAAPELTRSVRMMAARIGADSDYLIDLLISQIVTRDALAYEAVAYGELGQNELAEESRMQLARHKQLMDNIDLQNGKPRQIAHTGLLWDTIGGGVVSFSLSSQYMEPMRTTEHIVALQLGLLTLLGLLTALAMLFGSSPLESLFVDKRNKGVFLFIGWRRIGLICLLSIVLPLAFYGWYVYVQITMEDSFGLNYTAGRVLLEWTVVISIICMLLIAMSARAVRQRAKHLGISVPQSRALWKRKWIALPALAATAAVALYIALWWLGPFRPSEIQLPYLGTFRFLNYSFSIRHCSQAGLVLAALMLAWALAEAVRAIRLGKMYCCYRRSLYRSMSPMFAAAVILVGLACGTLLDHAERNAASRITGQASGSLVGRIIDNSPYRLLRNKFRAGHKAMLSSQSASAEPVGLMSR